MTAIAHTTSEPFTTLAGLRAARRKARPEIARQLDVAASDMRLNPGCFVLEAHLGGRWVGVERADFGTYEDRLRMNRHAATPTTYRLVANVAIKTAN